MFNSSQSSDACSQRYATFNSMISDRVLELMVLSSFYTFVAEDVHYIYKKCGWIPTSAFPGSLSWIVQRLKQVDDIPDFEDWGGVKLFVLDIIAVVKAQWFSGVCFVNQSALLQIGNTILLASMRSNMDPEYGLNYYSLMLRVFGHSS